MPVKAYVDKQEPFDYGETRPDGQFENYPVLPDEELTPEKFVRPFRTAYKHLTCGVATRMGAALAETYARDPGYYGSTFCAGCKRHFPVQEFVWEGTSTLVGT